tara:strand:+ start:449 stop:763 length:315 start_codon:yes stop_codon:yes gene_type:complete
MKARRIALTQSSFHQNLFRILSVGFDCMHVIAKNTDVRLADNVKESSLLLQDIYSMVGFQLAASNNFDSTYYVEGNRERIQQVIIKLKSNTKKGLQADAASRPN